MKATECNAPKWIVPIMWKLLTNLSVSSLADAKEKLSWYAMRWKIEMFLKIIKSGCRAEDSRLRTAERFVNLIAIFCIISWRIFWITMIKREVQDAKASLAFTSEETAVLNQLSEETKVLPLSSCIMQVAKLCGYLARATDPPPGNTVIWRGLSQLNDLVLESSLCNRNCR